MRRSWAALLLVAALPLSARADCWVTWNCGSSRQCAQVYGGRASGRNGPFPSCSGWQKRDLHSNCTCGGGGGGSLPTVNSGTGLSQQQQLGLQMGAAAGAIIGQGIRQMLQPRDQPPPEPPSYEPQGPSDVDRQLEENRRRLREKMGGDGGKGMSFRVDDDEPPKKKGCEQVRSDCAKALADQGKAMDASRSDAAAFPAAIVTGHANQGIDLATNSLGDALMGQKDAGPPLYQYREQPGLPVKSFDDAVAHMDDVLKNNQAAKRYEPKGKSLLDAAGGGKKLEHQTVVDEGRKRLDQDYRDARSLFHMKIKDCAREKDNDRMNACLKEASAGYEKQLASLGTLGLKMKVWSALKKVPGGKAVADAFGAAINRVDEAKSALQGYADKALDRFQGLANDAADCLGDCK